MGIRLTYFILPSAQREKQTVQEPSSDMAPSA